MDFSQFEFDAARASSAPILTFLVDDAYPWPPDLIDVSDAAARLKTFKERLQSELAVGYFTTPSDLALRVIQALQAFLSKQRLRHKRLRHPRGGGRRSPLAMNSSSRSRNTSIICVRKWERFGHRSKSLEQTQSNPLPRQPVLLHSLAYQPKEREMVCAS